MSFASSTSAEAAPEVLPYALNAGDGDWRALIVRIWWAGLVWAISYFCWYAAGVAVVALQTGSHRFPFSWAEPNTLPELTAAVGAGLLGLMLMLEYQCPRLSRRVRLAALIAVIGVISGLIPDGVKVWEGTFGRVSSPAIVIIEIVDSLAERGGWLLVPAAILVGGAMTGDRLRRRAGTRAPRPFAVLLAACCAAGFVTPTLLDFGYIATDPTLHFAQLIQQPAWAGNLVEAIAGSISTAFLTWTWWRSRKALHCRAWAVRTASLLPILAVLFSLALQRMHGPWLRATVGPLIAAAWTMRLVFSYPFQFAAMLPALTWPSRFEQA